MKLLLLLSQVCAFTAQTVRKQNGRMLLQLCRRLSCNKLFVTTQPSSKKVLKIFIRNKELIHCRKKKNSRRKEKTFDSLFLWISSFVLYCSSGKKGYFYPPFPFSTMFYPQSFCRTASYPRFAFSQPFLYNRNITEWKEACRIGPQI